MYKNDLKFAPRIEDISEFSKNGYKNGLQVVYTHENTDKEVLLLSNKHPVSSDLSKRKSNDQKPSTPNVFLLSANKQTGEQAAKSSEFNEVSP